MYHYQQLIASLSPVAQRLYYFIKNQKDWVSQQDVIIFRGKDDKRTRLYIKLLKSYNLIKIKKVMKKSSDNRLHEINLLKAK